MKNLILIGENRRVFSSLHSQSSKRLSLPDARICDICHDPNDDPDDFENFPTTFLLFNSGILVASTPASGIISSPNIKADLNEECLWTTELPCMDEDDKNSDNTWFSITFVSELNSLICLSHSGNIVTVDPQTGKCDSVGAFSNGISDGQWSPDEEILALFTYNAEGRSVLLTMNLEFEVLNEVSVPQPCLPTNEKSSLHLPLAHIAWRPDATKLVISSSDDEDKQCRIRIYDRDTSKMEYIAREEDGSGKLVRNLQLDSCVAWGGDNVSFIVAAIQQRKKKMPTVVFMEPIGLRHREFQLREEKNENVTDISVVDMLWNIESDILAIVLDEKKKIGSRIQMWHRSNYHWYMKYELRYKDQKVQKMRFDPVNSYRLAVALNRRCDIESNHMEQIYEWRIYEFCWDVSTVAVGCPLSTATIIDGRNLNFTPLSKAIVPPPMYAATIHFDSPVNHVAHFPHNVANSSNENMNISALATLSDGVMVLLGHSERENIRKQNSSLIGNYSPPSFICQVSKAEFVEDLSCMREMTILGRNSNDDTVNILAVVCSSSNYEHIIEIQINLSTSTCIKLNSMQLEGKVLRVTNWADSTSGAVIQFTDGTLLSYDSFDGIMPLSCETLMEPCPWISAISVSTQSESYPTQLVMGISKRSRLYCNDILISSAASSFVTNAYPHQILSYTTLGSIAQLRTLPLAALKQYDPLAGLDNDFNAMVQGEGYEPRAVERGSVLVSISNQGPVAILQLPRGNLEAIYPRSLVIPHVMNLISEGKYFEAVSMMRKQKVDMNLIVDLNPNRIVSQDAEKFVLDIKREDYLNLFIANLRNDDVTMYKYPIPSWIDVEQNSWTNSLFEFSGSKVNLVCQTLRRAMLEQEVKEESHFLLPILSTFAKEEPPKLMEALMLIRNTSTSSLTIRNQNQRTKSAFLSDRAQSSIQYLAFLADYETLYNTAIGMYDFDLAKAVARHSQLDPKIYIPQLKRWKELQPDGMAKYEVDLKLKRYDSALRHLYDAGQHQIENKKDRFEQCFDLIVQHDLHALGLKLFNNNKSQHNRIMTSLGEKLLDQKEGNAALSIFLSTVPQDLEGAKRAAKMCGDWQTFFSCFKSQHDLRKVAINLAEEISTGGSIVNRRENMNTAARILLDYTKDVEGALEKLLHGELWSEARRLALLHSKEYFERRILDSAKAFGETCIRDLEERAETFEKSNVRYAIVVKLRSEIKRKEEEEYRESNVGTENESTYSILSELSNLSLKSDMSGSSVGSVMSVSSVISAGRTSAFNMTSNDDANKHKSKFNKTSSEKKKSKKKKKSRGKSNKIRPGSQEELNGLIDALKTSCLDEQYLKIIEETILFLTQMNEIFFAKEIYDAFEKYRKRINQSQSSRQDKLRAEKEEAVRIERKEGQTISAINTFIGCEEEVDSLRCNELPSFFGKLFSYVCN